MDDLRHGDLVTVTFLEHGVRDASIPYDMPVIFLKYTKGSGFDAVHVLKYLFNDQLKYAYIADNCETVTLLSRYADAIW